eukprot:TRINITY_DN5163_c0_g1_i1.p5 TRINITY_DN5163_c0_g1~~TRINITY_DN5163_c0_g1_i1.p5  ORF type:complete len:106 (-),score=26.93 TRINITY_DN5163_c0_g1_i1:471-788(-)
MSSGQTLGVKAQRFRGHTSPHRNVKEYDVEYSTTSVPEGRRSMESVPENSTMGEDFRAGNERLLRQILEDSATLEVGQENNVPMLANGGGYDSWGFGGQVVSNQC